MDINVYTCKYNKNCNEKYNDEIQLEDHYKKIEVSEPEKITKKYSCDKEGCLTTFSSKNAYKNHVMKIHENVRLICMYCQKEYKYSSCKKYFFNFFFNYFFNLFIFFNFFFLLFLLFSLFFFFCFFFVNFLYLLYIFFLFNEFFFLLFFYFFSLIFFFFFVTFFSYFIVSFYDFFNFFVLLFLYILVN